MKERIESGLLDIGLLTEPVDISRYAFQRMPQKDCWGVLAPRDSALAEKKIVTPSDLPVSYTHLDVYKRQGY